MEMLNESNLNFSVNLMIFPGKRIKNILLREMSNPLSKFLR